MSDVHLRPRNPAEEDALGGAHQRVAEGIEALIRHTPGGRSLAIMGSWGSGKSTIVELLKAKLEKPSPSEPVTTRVFLFDAWAHQGDPLRRSFLESFFEFLTRVDDWVQKDAPWIPGGKISVEQEVKRTTGQTEAVTTRTNKSLSAWGTAIGITALAAAAASAILPKLDTNRVETWRYFWINLCLVALPFVLAAFASICGRKTSQTLYQLLVRDAEEERTIETSKTLDPTSIDFHKVFAGLCRHALSARRRLVIVILAT